MMKRSLAINKASSDSSDNEDFSATSSDNKVERNVSQNGFKTLCKKILSSVRLVTIEPVMFFFMFGTYLYLALLELYIYQHYALQSLKNASYDNMLPNQSFCVNATFLDHIAGNGTNEHVLSQASLLELIISATGQVVSVFVALLAGPLSDRYGRKPMLVFALTGNFVATVFNIIIVYFQLDIYFLIASGLMMGITGGFTIIMSVSVAYLADVSSSKWLTQRIAILQAMLYTSQALSDVITGQWLKRTGCYFDPLVWLSAIAGFLGLLYLIILKEPLSRDMRLSKLKADGEDQILSLLTRGFKIFCYRIYSRWRLWLTLITMSITVINGIGTFEIMTLFQIAAPLKWGPSSIGWYGLVNTVAQAFSLFVILPIVIALRIPDSLIVLFGLLITSGMYFFTGYLRTSWEMYLVGALMGLDPTVTPVIRAILSKLVSQKDQGALFAIVTAVQVLSAAFASILYNTVFRETLKQHLNPGLAFIVMGILGLIPVPLMLILFLLRNGGGLPSNKLRMRKREVLNENEALLSD